MVNILRDLGHEVITSHDADQANQGIPDNEVLSYATQNNLVVITFNRDDFIKLHNKNIQHCGIVICKTDRDYQGQMDYLNMYLQDQDSLSDRLIRIKKQQQKGLSQPVFIAQEYFR